MNYLTPGGQLTAARWNDLFQQADAQLTTMLGGLSAVFALCGTSGPYATPNYADKQWDRGFFFGFDPVNPPATLHPVALQFIKGYLGQVQTYQQALFWRQYSHSAITGQLSGLSQVSNTSKWHVVKLALPTWAAWSAAVYPSGFSPSSNSGLKQTISSVDYPAYNCLDVSLQVHTASVGGTPYNVTFDSVLDADHAQPLKGIDVFLLGNVSWDTTNWNKYFIVRAHNCGQTAATIFGTSINPGACRCFRNIAGTWTAQGNYFHWMQTGDGRFLQMRETGNPSNNGYTGGAPSIFMPGIVTDVLFNVMNGWGDRPQGAAGNFGMQADITKFFDLTPVYNNPAYAKASPGENDPPANGYFPVPSAGDLIGDLIIPRGKFLVANRAVPQVIHATMYQTVVMTLAIPTPTYNFTDGSNTVANVSNAAVYNVTTGQSIPMQSDPSDITTVNWQVNYTTMQIGIIPRGSYWTGSAWAPITPTPYAPFISQGDVLKITFDYIPPDDHVWVDFDSFATLAAKLTAIGLASRALSESNPMVSGATLNNLEIYSSASWHLIDLSCPLVTFLTGGSGPLPAKVVGSTQSSTPPSLKLPWLVFVATTVVDNPTSTTLTYKNWATDSNGNPVVGSVVTVTVNNDGSTSATASTVFLPTDSISTLQSWITSNSQAGGVLKIQNFNFFSTTFGHVMTWEEIWPLDARFAALAGYYVPNFGGNLRTLSVIYEQGVGLHVTRALYLNETKYFSGYGTGNANPWENGIFPPISSASRYLFWHYARIDRQFINPRWYQHLSADSPWMPNTGWSNQKFPTGALFQWSDKLSTIEFNFVVSFYEAAPLGTDTVGSPSARAKTGISRMGTFSRSADIWSPFSYWLQKITTLTYPNGAGTSSISTSSGWYYANTGSVMSNATISDPIPTVLPCQMEHFNAVGSLVNGIPQFRWNMTPQIGFSFNTGYTLNFAAGNIIIVNGGSGFAVGQALNFNLKVASVDGNGGITGVAQNGSVVVNSYDAYSTPQRPFALGGNATCDTSVGDGSTLNFIPTHTNIGVPTLPTPPNSSGDDFHDRMVDTYFPRQAFYSWNGATPGGADPVKDYLTTLGVAVQTTVPDNYGQPLPVYEYWLENDGSVTTSGVSSYQYGCNANFQTKVNAYRWIKIDDARTLYGNLSVPFILNELVVPYSWQVFNVNGSNTQTPTVTNPTNQMLINLGYSAPYGTTPNPPALPPPPANNGGGDLGSVNQIQADWFNDANGNWVRSYRGENVCSSSSPLAGPVRFWLAQTNYDVQQTANYNYSVTSVQNYIFPYTPWYAYGDYTSKQVESKTTFAIPSQFAPAGYVTAFSYFPPFGNVQVMVNYPQKRAYDLFAVLARYENVADKCVACLPQNAGYYDEPWVASNVNVFYNLGTQVVPIIADNSVESSLADVAYISGAGGVGQYETLITTGLLNARLVTVSVDGQIQNNPPPPGGGI